MKNFYYFSICLFLFFNPIITYAQQHITTSLTAFPCLASSYYPSTILFKGTITVTEPGEIQYQFIRNNGETSPLYTLQFQRRGTKHVTSRWTIGKNLSGWSALQVLHPQNIMSAKAFFTVSSTPRHTLSKRILKKSLLTTNNETL